MPTRNAADKSFRADSDGAIGVLVAKALETTVEDLVTGI
jgi:hypothetical protein